MNPNSTEMNRAAELLHERIGLKPDPSFRPRLSRALRDVANDRGVDRSTLIGALERGGPLLEDVLDRITVQETSFFRHPEQFETITRELLPRLSPPWTAWSTACANGQEAYSVAMTLRENTPGAVSAPSVLATDVSAAALTRTAAARYSERELHGVNAARRGAHFAASGAHEWQVIPAVRQLVNVRRHNLLDALPDEAATSQLVLCRNVLIYFSEPHVASFLDRLADVMRPDAYLIVGGAETIWQASERFEPLQLGACFVYRRRATRGRRAAAPAPFAPNPVHRRVVASPPTPPRPQSSNVVADPVSAPPSETAAAGELSTRGREAMAAGDAATAVVAYRQWTFLIPDDPIAHFHLGTALAEVGEAASSARAIRACERALHHLGDAELSTVLDGYDPAEFRRLVHTMAAPPTPTRQKATAP